ncbi:MAG: ABC transporter ATP-binding protein [Endomicrobiia bacterium]
MQNEVLKVEDLTKYYDSFLAVDNVSFSVFEGEILGLLGPNGAGKTTIINIILGVLKQDKGYVKILNKDLKICRTELTKKINFAATYCSLPGNLTVYQNLYVFGLLYEVRNLKEKIKFLEKEFGLNDIIDKKVGLLSSGELAKVNLAKVFINDPKLIFLDEPTSSLDPNIAKEIRNKILKKAKQDKISILWTSHNMSEVEEVCDRVLFISHGKILAEGHPKELPKIYNKKNLEELFIYLAKEHCIFEKEL